jgi:hypothetical protein
VGHRDAHAAEQVDPLGEGVDLLALLREQPAFLVDDRRTSLGSLRG